MNLSISQSVGDFTFKFIGGYDKSAVDNRVDLDGGTRSVDEITFLTDAEQMTQKFQIAYDSGPLNAIGGLYYFQEDLDADSNADLLGELTFAQGALPLITRATRKNKAYAMFGQWAPLTDGIEFSLLYSSAETGRWTVIFRSQPGSFFGPHRHLGAGEYDVIKGRMTYRMGEAAAGTYGCEPLDIVHDHTAFPEYTELIFTNYGPIAFLDHAGEVASILDHKLLEALMDAA